MNDLVAWIKEQVRKSHLQELIKAHTGLSLTPPAIIAVVALAAASTALTVSTVSTLLAPPKKDDKSLDEIINNEIMTHTPSSNQRDVDVIPVYLASPIIEATKEEEEEDDEEEEEVEAPSKEETVETTVPTAPDEVERIRSDYFKATEEEEEAPVKKEVEAPAKEEPVETMAPTAADGEGSTHSYYDDFEETIASA